MTIDLTPLVQQYGGLWVGLADDEQTVIASGKTVQEVMKNARAQGMDKPILFRVPTVISPYVGA